MKRSLTMDIESDTYKEEIMNRIEEMMAQFHAEIVAYVAAHPDEPYAEVGRRFDTSENNVSWIARAAGLPRRRPGRRKKVAAASVAG